MIFPTVFNMYFKLVSFILLCYVFQTHGTFVEDYCWRNFDGTIPKDAYKAGVDRNGQPIYIGQVLFDNKLIPGKVHHNKGEVHIEFNYKAHTVNENIKILCTHHPERFEWIPTHTDEVMDLEKMHHLFEGGYEKGVTTYIGRTHSFEELTVGKEICWPSHCIPLTTVEKDKHYSHKNFEVLIYNPNGKAVMSSKDPAMRQPLTGERKSLSPFWYIFLSLGVVSIVVVVIILSRYCSIH